MPGIELRQADSRAHSSSCCSFLPGILKRGGSSLGKKKLGPRAGGFTNQRTKSFMVKLCSLMRKRLQGEVFAF